MPWAKLDDSYPTHPKVVAAGADGMALDAAAICYSNRYGTDGIIATAALPAVFPAIRSPKKVAAKLVAVGRWHEAGHDCPDCPQTSDGWVVHDFLAYNPSAEKAAEKSANRAEAGRKGGKKSRPPGSKQEAPDDEEAGSKEGSNAEANASPPLRSEANPDPAPTQSSNEDCGVASAPPEPRESSEPYARRLVRRLQDDHGWTVPADISQRPRHERYQALLAAALELLPEEEHHDVSMGLLVSLWQQVAEDYNQSLPADARSHLGRLVKSHGASNVLEALGEALVWGAGLGEDYVGDSRAVTKYVTKVLGNRKAAA